jgi:hypothetical protein
VLSLLLPKTKVQTAAARAPAETHLEAAESSAASA